MYGKLYTMFLKEFPKSLSIFKICFLSKLVVSFIFENANVSYWAVNNNNQKAKAHCSVHNVNKFKTEDADEKGIGVKKEPDDACWWEEKSGVF